LGEEDGEEEAGGSGADYENLKMMESLRCVPTGGVEGEYEG